MIDELDSIQKEVFTVILYLLKIKIENRKP